MPERTDDDLIIIIANELRRSGDSPMVEYSEWDSALGLPDGTTAKHIEAAAADIGLEVARKGSTHASLRKKIGAFFA